MTKNAKMLLGQSFAEDRGGKTPFEHVIQEPSINCEPAHHPLWLQDFNLLVTLDHVWGRVWEGRRSARGGDCSVERSCGVKGSLLS